MITLITASLLVTCDLLNLWLDLVEFTMFTEIIILSFLLAVIIMVIKMAQDRLVPVGDQPPIALVPVVMTPDGINVAPTSRSSVNLSLSLSDLTLPKLDPATPLLDYANMTTSLEYSGSPPQLDLTPPQLDLTPLQSDTDSSSTTSTEITDDFKRFKYHLDDIMDHHAPCNDSLSPVLQQRSPGPHLLPRTRLQDPCFDEWIKNLTVPEDDLDEF